jgi:hypothetical protein
MKAEDFVGLSKKGAMELAEINNLIFRLVAINGESYLGYPEDTRADRVCVELVNGKVSAAAIQ